jgi:hypothetical protein
MAKTIDIPSYLLGRGAGGGGGGTSDYEELENKPSINGVTLEGELTTEDLGINIPIESISVNGTEVTPDEDKNVDLDVPVITYGTTDLTPGVSPLNEGEFYFVYE